MRKMYRAHQNKDGSVRIEERVIEGQPKYVIHYTTYPVALHRAMKMLGKHIARRRREFEKMLTEYRNTAFDHTDEIAEGIL